MWAKSGAGEYWRIIRASRWDAVCNVRWPGTWEAVVRRAKRGWTYTVGHYGRDEHVIAVGDAPTMRAARAAADATLESVADEIKSMRVADRWVSGRY